VQRLPEEPGGPEYLEVVTDLSESSSAIAALDSDKSGMTKA